jgi:hypothetical protein
MALIMIGGCTETILKENELPLFVDRMVINSSIDNINNISIELSTMAGAYTSDLPIVVGPSSDLTIQMYDVDQNLVPLTYSTTSRTFNTASPGLPGKTYSVVVAKKDYPTASAFCNVPEKVKNKSVGFIENGGVDMEGNPSDKIYLSFKDDGSTNYYSLEFTYYSETAQLFLPFDFATNNATLNAPTTFKTKEGAFVFTDKLFNGATSEFTAVAPRGLANNNTDVKYRVQLRSLNTDHYKYLLTLKQYEDESDQQNNGAFGSAVIVHSNINGGQGIFMASTLENNELK